MSGQREQECVRSADLCHREKLFSDAISRRYYAMLYVLRAIADTEGIDISSYSGGSHEKLRDSITDQIKANGAKGTFRNLFDTFKKMRTRADYRGYCAQETDSNEASQLLHKIEVTLRKHL